MTALIAYAALDALVVASFAVSIGLSLYRFHRSAREGLYDAAGATPLRGPR